MSFRVLVVDDEADNRDIIGEILEFNHIEHDMAAEGQSAVDMVAQGDYDLVLMDIMMPVMDGLEATKTIRDGGSDKAAIPIVAVTARRDLKAQAEWSKQGLNGFMSKPFTEANLMSLVDQYR